jgi:hypothetical protein
MWDMKEGDCDILPFKGIKKASGGVAWDIFCREDLYI